MNQPKNVEQQKFQANGESFTRGTYNGISVIIRDKDGYINATEMCRQFGKRFAKINENHAWQEYYKEFQREYSALPELGVHRPTSFSYQINKGLSTNQNYLRGTYVDPRLINYIAIWCSPKYAVAVGKIMDSINDRVHQELANQNLPDTPENAKPAFDNTINQLQQQIRERQDLVDSQTWGVRDSPLELDGYEKSEMRDAVNAYLKARNKLKDEFGVWLEQYYPDLQNI